MPPAHQHADEPEARAHVEVPAARLAELLVGDAQPLVGGRVGEHALEQRARLRLAGRPGRAGASCRARGGRRARRARARARPATAARGPASERQRRAGVQPRAGGQRRRRPARARGARSARAAYAGRRARRPPSTRRGAERAICSMTAMADPLDDHRLCQRVPAPARAGVPILGIRPMPRNDPTDTGGLFIGRRPGTGPLHYRAAPGARRRAAPPGRRGARGGGAARWRPCSA